MGAGFRRFWIDDDDRLHHVGFRRFMEIFHDGTEVLPEFAGRMVPVIEVVYETMQRKPSQLIRARGCRYPFDAGGRLDVETQRRLYPWTALLDEQAERYLREPGNVRYIDSRIAANRIRREVFFDPTPEQIRVILLALRIIAPAHPRHPLRAIKTRTIPTDLPLPTQDVDSP